MVLLRLGLSALLFIFVASVIVDDTSDLIQYSNNNAWEGGSASQTTSVIPSPGNSYEGTYHQSNQGSTFNFSFTGTSIAVYGIIAKYQETILSFAIDGGAVALTQIQPTIPETLQTTPTLPETDFNYSVQVFSSGGLSVDTHTIRMRCAEESCVFGLDYLEYTAADVAATTTTTGAQSLSQNASGTNTQTTSVTTASATNLSATHSLPTLSTSISDPGTTDDLPTIFPSDSRIVYQPHQWASNTSCGLSSMVATVSGSSFSFNFTGPSIWIYTATIPLGGKYGVLLNGTDMGVIDTTGPTCKVEASYHIENLDNFMHTLVVTNANGEIDFLGLRLASSVDQVTGSSTTLQGAPNTAVIAGGVIGGVAVLALLIFGIYLFLRRQRRNDVSRPETLIGEQRSPVVREEPYVTPLSEKQRLIAAEREAQHMAYRTYTKTMLPGMERSPSYEARGENENTATQELVPAYPPAPPSFRTLSVAAQYPYRPAADGHSSESHDVFDIAPSNNSRSLGDSLEDDGDPQASGASQEEAEQLWPTSAAPPYIDEVLARPDARNLSENDVDAIARRLAEVMRMNNTTRGGPGLLRERTAPPRELIDQLVEEHLGARELMD